MNDARGHLFDAPHMVVFSALAVMTTVLSFNLPGDAWRDWLDPRTRSQMAAQEFLNVNSQLPDRGHYSVRITGVPRPRLSVRAAFALLTPISKYPLDPK